MSYDLSAASRRMLALFVVVLLFLPVAAMAEGERVIVTEGISTRRRSRTRSLMRMSRLLRP
nr:hypothetical protein [Marinicella sp. W31]MDC2879816.1 hypothetical protein [Marinicella sp. W31]